MSAVAGGTVLVVEDNGANRRLACLLLESAGYRVLQAADAESGLGLARAQRPDLILMDVELPGMDGLSATRLLKQDPRTQATRVVALTGRAMREDRERARAAGCDGYIAKPIDSSSFLDVIAGMLRRE